MYSRRGLVRARIVARNEFLTQAEAARLLGVGERMGIGFALATNKIERAVLVGDGIEGVTRSSVEAELDWRQHATVGKKLRRSVRTLAQFF